MGATPEELVRKLSDLMHEFNVNGLNGSAVLDAVDQFVDTLSKLVPTGSGGGSGADIDDDATSPTTTWSSHHLAELFAGRAPLVWSSELEDFGGAEGAPGNTGLTLDRAFDELYSNVLGLVASAGAMFEFNSTASMDAFGISRKGAAFILASEVPAEPEQGKVYVIVGADGTLTFHLPNPNPEV